MCQEKLTQMSQPRDIPVKLLDFKDDQLSRTIKSLTGEKTQAGLRVYSNIQCPKMVVQCLKDLKGKKVLLWDFMSSQITL